MRQKRSGAWKDGSGAWKTQLQQGMLLPAKGTREPKETYPVRRARQKHHQMVWFSINFQYSVIYVSQ